MLIKKRITITITALGAALAAIIGAIIVPSVFAIGRLQAEIGAARAELDARYEARKEMRSAAAALENSQERLVALSRTAIKEGAELDFVSAIEGAAPAGVEQDIYLETANQKELSDWEREIPLRIVIRGGFLEAVRYLDAIDRLPYAVIIDAVGVSGPRDAFDRREGANLPRTEFTGSVYWQSKQAPNIFNATAQP